MRIFRSHGPVEVARCPCLLLEGDRLAKDGVGEGERGSPSLARIGDGARNIGELPSDFPIAPAPIGLAGDLGGSLGGRAPPGEFVVIGLEPEG